jgi:hypothetical protein
MDADERLVATELARLYAVQQQPGEDHDDAATAAYLQHVILSRLTGAQAAAILRHMAHDAIQHFGERRPEPGVSGVIAQEWITQEWVRGRLLALRELTWRGTPYRLRRFADQAGIRVPGGSFFWNEGHFAYLGRRFLARRYDARSG